MGWTTGPHAKHQVRRAAMAESDAAEPEAERERRKDRRSSDQFTGLIGDDTTPVVKGLLGGGCSFFYVNLYLGKMSHFDSYFSRGLKPPAGGLLHKPLFVGSL